MYSLSLTLCAKTLIFGKEYVLLKRLRLQLDHAAASEVAVLTP